MEGKPPGREVMWYTGSSILEEDIQLGKQRKVACTFTGSEKTSRGRRDVVAESQAPGNRRSTCGQGSTMVETYLWLDA